MVSVVATIFDVVSIDNDVDSDIAAGRFIPLFFDKFPSFLASFAIFANRPFSRRRSYLFFRLGLFLNSFSSPLHHAVVVELAVDG